jgi:hypothetical protein
MAKRFVSSLPKRLDEALWVVDCDGYDRGLHVPLRMTVVHLTDGTLWLHSPIPIDDALARELEALGPVAHVVAPSRGHHLFVAAAKERYPNARLWGSPGLLDARLRSSMDAQLSEHELPWKDELTTIHLAGTPAIDEYVFFHVATRTLICADMVVNVTSEPSWLSRQLYRALGVWGRPGPTRYWRFMTRDGAAAGAALDRVLACNPTRVVMAHGDIVDENALAWLRTALRRPPTRAPAA